MRKIISILVALGVILGLTLVAVPAAAAPPVCPTGCTLTLTGTFCAGGTSVYTIGNITVPITLTGGTDSLSVDFPAGTDLSGVAYTDVTICGSALDNAAALTKSGTHLEAVIPVALIGHFPAFSTGHSIVVADVVNPATPGKACLFVDYKLACCAAVQFACFQVTIAPAISTYSLMVDFGPTYPGIAEDFVPPFKACGQDDTTAAAIQAGFNTTQLGGIWYDQFDIVLVEEQMGCATPCANATLTFNVTAFPSPSTGAVVSLNISGEFFALTPTASSGQLVQNLTLVLGSDITLPSLLHFNMVGEYTICFDVTCPGNPAGTCPLCLPATGPQSIVGGKVCYDFNVHQWKDAGKIILDEKWNLISLPLVPFDGTLSVLQESLTPEALADWVSIWYYTPPWGTPTSLVDGKSYWVRMDYPLAASYTWWIWGTAKAMPPAAPSAYPMTAAAWNMFGFTSLTDMTLAAYLWNFTTLPLVYGWNNTGDWATSGWQVKTGPSTLNSGQGYWGFFPTGGIVVPP